MLLISFYVLETTFFVFSQAERSHRIMENQQYSHILNCSNTYEGQIHHEKYLSIVSSRRYKKKMNQIQTPEYIRTLKLALSHTFKFEVLLQAIGSKSKSQHPQFVTEISQINEKFNVIKYSLEKLLAACLVSSPNETSEHTLKSGYMLSYTISATLSGMKGNKWFLNHALEKFTLLESILSKALLIGAGDDKSLILNSLNQLADAKRTYTEIFSAEFE